MYPPSLIFAFVEDGTLEVFSGTIEARRNYEGIDVESGTVRFYDAMGTFLRPQFTTPNRNGKLLGPIGWVASGTYELVPNKDATEDSFALALYETNTLDPNPWFKSLDELKDLASRRRRLRGLCEAR